MLPPEILRTLELAPGTRVLIDEQDGKITLKPASDEESGLMEKDGILILHARITEDVSEIVTTHREKRIAEITGQNEGSL
jgi:bifunctional DNA-binding transcriptional regulator/antitoxin component of YhaV-PrlF toxin-antitoxin module